MPISTKYKWLPLHKIKRYESEMKRLEVSQVARSPRGFLTTYKKIGYKIKSNEHWMAMRESFIARHLAQYRENPTKRRWLALVAWAYRPDRRFG